MEKELALLQANMCLAQDDISGVRAALDQMDEDDGDGKVRAPIVRCRSTIPPRFGDTSRTAQPRTPLLGASRPPSLAPLALS